MKVGLTYKPPFTRNALGFESFFDEMNRFLTSEEVNSGYPPHNLIKVGDDKYLVEIAVSGFMQDELDVSIKDGYLIIKGEKAQKEEDVSYIYKGIGTRNFTKSFKIADTINVVGAEIKDGILRIALVNVVPEHMRERKIEIGTISQQLLTEA